MGSARTREWGTCPRCRGTEREGRLPRILLLGDAGPPLDTPLSTAESVQEPVASSENLIAGYPLEGWLGVETRESPCCVACGEADCRTVEVAGRIYGAIP